MAARRVSGQRRALQERNLSACRRERFELKIESIPRVISSTPVQVAARLGALLEASAVSTMVPSGMLRGGSDEVTTSLAGAAP